MLDRKVFIRESTTIYRFTALTITISDITALNNKPWYNAMEFGSLVMKISSNSSIFLFACYQDLDGTQHLELSWKYNTYVDVE